MVAELVDLDDGVLAWVHDVRDPFGANVGVVVDDDGITLVDSGGRVGTYEPLARELARFALPVTTIVLTHEHPDHVAGAGARAFGDPEIVASTSTRDALAAAPIGAALGALHPAVADELAGLAHPTVTTVVDRRLRLGRLTLDVHGGHTGGDLVVDVDGADVVFAGDLCFFDTVPLALGADLRRWVASLGALAGAGRIVPGHGPVGGDRERRAVEDYLAAVLDAADRGDEHVADGPWSSWWDVWGHRVPHATHRINVEQARDPAGFPPTLVELLQDSAAS
ncbi:MAG: MBL fold metallo-hydrolase [Actinomycetota bacterium]|nr:MBL fold metallo-hydrolase [Actinomycetota bacterium]